MVMIYFNGVQQKGLIISDFLAIRHIYGKRKDMFKQYVFFYFYNNPFVLCMSIQM